MSTAYGPGCILEVEADISFLREHHLPIMQRPGGETDAYGANFKYAHCPAPT